MEQHALKEQTVPRGLHIAIPLTGLDADARQTVQSSFHQAVDRKVLTRLCEETTIDVVETRWSKSALSDIVNTVDETTRIGSFSA